MLCSLFIWHQTCLKDGCFISLTVGIVAAQMHRRSSGREPPLVGPLSVCRGIGRRFGFVFVSRCRSASAEPAAFKSGAVRRDSTEADRTTLKLTPQSGKRDDFIVYCSECYSVYLFIHDHCFKCSAAVVMVVIIRIHHSYCYVKWWRCLKRWGAWERKDTIF